MLVTSNGIVTRLKAGDISCQGRPATGVRAQNLADTDTVASVTKIVNTDKDEDYNPATNACPSNSEESEKSEQTTIDALAQEVPESSEQTEE